MIKREIYIAKPTTLRFVEITSAFDLFFDFDDVLVEFWFRVIKKLPPIYLLVVCELTFKLFFYFINSANLSLLSNINN